MGVFFDPAVIGDPSYPIRQCSVIRHDRPGIPVRPKILPGVERECAGIAKAAYRDSIEARSVSLSAIFNDPKIIFRGQIQDCFHVAGMPVKMHGHQRYRSIRNPAARVLTTETISSRVDIAKNDPVSGPRNSLGTRNKAIRRHDYFAGRHIQRLDYEFQSISTVSNPYAVTRRLIICEGGFEFLDMSATNKRRLLDHGSNCVIYLFFYRAVLRRQIQESNHSLPPSVFGPSVRINLAGFPA
jgi:hypothetical protein